MRDDCLLEAKVEIFKEIIMPTTLYEYEAGSLNARLRKSGCIGNEVIESNH